VLKTQREGWSVGPGPCGYGYRCEITDLEESWPKIALELLARYVPGDDAYTDPCDEDLVNQLELDVQVEFTWDRRRARFRPSTSRTLSVRDIKTLCRNPIDLLEQNAKGGPLSSEQDGPVTNKRVKRSRALAGWGL
jgi:hypothetical protein